MRRVLILLLLPLIVGMSVNAQSLLSDGEVESRAREVGHALRCVICQNQSIEESDATLAEDMRTLVRARIRAGDSNDQVMAYMQSRYGDFVLLKPPVQTNTYALWFIPFILVGLGMILFIRRSEADPNINLRPLSDDERETLQSLNSKK